MTTKDDVLATVTASKPSIANLAQGLDWIQGIQESPLTPWRVTSAVPPADFSTRAGADRRELHFELLKQSLHAAVKLEFATIPPYLCAVWSIKDELHEVAKSIREIVQEEMLHLAFVANMLRSIGGIPRFNTDVPEYPGKLPRAVHPDLVVRLCGLSKPALKAFMQIEHPESIVPHGHFAERVRKEARTIGHFYAGIDRAFKDLRPTIKTDHQIAGPLATAIIQSVEDVHIAIKVIRGQGEGSNGTPFDSGPDDLAHYYRFEELYDGRRLEYDACSKSPVHGAPIQWPDCWPMKATPRGGYKEKAVPEDAWLLLKRFDEIYSQMLDHLQNAWTADGQASFLRAIELMFALEAHAKPLMRIQVPGDSKHTLGPCFRYIPESSRVFIKDHEVSHGSRP